MNEETKNLHFDWKRFDTTAEVRSSSYGGARAYPTYYYQIVVGDWKILAVASDGSDNLYIVMHHFYFGSCWNPPLDQPYVPKNANSLRDVDVIIKDFIDYYENLRSKLGMSLIDRAMQELDDDGQ